MELLCSPSGPNDAFLVLNIYTLIEISTRQLAEMD